MAEIGKVGSVGSYVAILPQGQPSEIKSYINTEYSNASFDQKNALMESMAYVLDSVGTMYPDLLLSEQIEMAGSIVGYAGDYTQYGRAGATENINKAGIDEVVESMKSLLVIFPESGTDALSDNFIKVADEFKATYPYLESQANRPGMSDALDHLTGRDKANYASTGVGQLVNDLDLFSAIRVKNPTMNSVEVIEKMSASALAEGVEVASERQAILGKVDDLAAEMGWDLNYSSVLDKNLQELEVLLLTISNSTPVEKQTFHSMLSVLDYYSKNSIELDKWINDRLGIGYSPDITAYLECMKGLRPRGDRLLILNLSSEILDGASTVYKPGDIDAQLSTKLSALLENTRVRGADSSIFTNIGGLSYYAAGLDDLQYVDFSGLDLYITQAKSEFPGETDEWYEQMWDVTQSVSYVNTTQEAYVYCLYAKLNGNNNIAEVDFKSVMDMMGALEALPPVTTDEAQATNKQLNQFFSEMIAVYPVPIYPFQRSSYTIPLDLNIYTDHLMAELGYEMVPSLADPIHSFDYVKGNVRVTKDKIAHFKDIYFKKLFKDSSGRTVKNPPAMSSDDALHQALKDSGLPSDVIAGFNDHADIVAAASHVAYFFDNGYSDDVSRSDIHSVVDSIREYLDTPLPYGQMNPDNYPLPPPSDPEIYYFLMTVGNSAISGNNVVGTNAGLQNMNRLTTVYDDNPANASKPPATTKDIATMPEADYEDPYIRLLADYGNSDNVFLVVLCVMIKYSEQCRFKLDDAMDDLDAQQDKYEELTGQLESLNDQYAAANTDGRKKLQPQIDSVNADLNVQSNVVNQAVTTASNRNTDYQSSQENVTSLMNKMQDALMAVIRGMG